MLDTRVCCLLGSFIALSSGHCYDGDWTINQTWSARPSCEIRNFTSIEARACLNGRHLFVAGNSVSRHFFFHILDSITMDMKDDVTEEGRKHEKARLAECANIEALGASYDICGDESVTNMYNKHIRYNCVYNMNHLDRLCRKEWRVGNFSGNLTFAWTYDWWLPLFSELLLQPNTVLTPNAGLNRAWAYDMKWDKNSSSAVVAEQFPRLWNSTTHDSSLLIYRLTTKSCQPQDNLVVQDNLFAANYMRAHPSSRRRFLDLYAPTSKRDLYLDCNHHPGPQSELHFQMFLNELCLPP